MKSVFIKKLYPVAFLVFIISAGIFLSGCAGSGNQPSPRKPGVDAGNEKAAMEHYINGQSAEAKGDYANAILEYQDALLAFPKAAVYYSLGKSYYFTNRLPQALNHSRRSLELDSTQTEFYYLLSEIYSAARLQDSAALVLESLIRRDSSEVEAYYKLAGIYETNKPKQAIAIYKKLLRRVGSEWNTLQHIAQLYERLGDYEGCVSSLEELRVMDPGRPEIDLLLVEFLIKSKQTEKASLRLDEMSELYPDNIEVTEKKAQLLLAQGKWKEAADSYKKAFGNPAVTREAKIRIGILYFANSLKDSTLLPVAKEILTPLDKDTSDWEVKMYLGAIAMMEKNDSVAIELFHKVISIAPWNGEAWMRLGGLYFDNRKYKESIKVLSEAVAQFPEEFPINLILGFSYAQTEKYDSAGKYLGKAVQLNDTDLNALSTYGYVLHKLNKPVEAVHFLKKALAIDKKNVDIMSTLGLIYDDREMWAECDSIYNAALAIDSSNALISNNFAYSLSKRSIRLDEALRLVTHALKKEPANSSYLDTKGWIYYQMNNYEEAKKFIEESIKAGGEKSVILDHLGDVLFMMGKKEDAVNTWKKALLLDEGNPGLKKKIEKGSL